MRFGKLRAIDLSAKQVMLSSYDVQAHRRPAAILHLSKDARWKALFQEGLTLLTT